MMQNLIQDSEIEGKTFSEEGLGGRVVKIVDV